LIFKQFVPPAISRRFEGAGGQPGGCAVAVLEVVVLSLVAVLLLSLAAALPLR
jgi:hypothetical protein